ncbi:MAG: Na/Pi cotransporter family protein [Magnetococcales bacterium]|nr:Na/Pi cotransporter family protein [Magnetococcales bacterium]
MKQRLQAWSQDPRSVFIIAAVVALSVVMVSDPALAGSGKGKSIDWAKMIMTLFGGLAIFLYGMEKMTEALRNVAGDRMKNILAKLTTNRVAGVLTGAGTTAVVQSSSVTTVIVVGFVTAGLMNLNQAIGVIFGANIGTTITAQIVAFKVTKYALWMVAGGYLMNVVGKKDSTRQWGLMLLGLGLVFFGMKVMGGAMKPLRSYEPFLALMTSMENPIYGILFAALFTGLVQSSSATTSIVIVMASEGLITLPAGIALAFGANIGTCVTAMLACIGKSREAIRAAVAHLLFNVLGVLLWVFFIDNLANLVVTISPMADPSLTGLEKAGAEVPRQIANAHTIFNVANTLIFLPFVGIFASIITKLVPEKELTVADKAAAKFKPKYLDEGMLTTPAIALSMAWRETHRMSWVVKDMLNGVTEGCYNVKMEKMNELRDMDDQVDALYSGISHYLTEIGKTNLTKEHAAEAMMAMTVVSELENIGDIVQVNYHHITAVAAKQNVVMDEETRTFLQDSHNQIMDAFSAAMVAFENGRMDMARKVIDMEDEVLGRLNQRGSERHSAMLQGEHGVEKYALLTMESDIMENYKRVYQHTLRIAALVAANEAGTALVAVPTSD